MLGARVGVGISTPPGQWGRTGVRWPDAVACHTKSAAVQARGGNWMVRGNCGLKYKPRIHFGGCHSRLCRVFKVGLGISQTNADFQ